MSITTMIISGFVFIILYAMILAIWIMTTINTEVKKGKQPIMVGNLTQSHFLIKRALRKTAILIENRKKGYSKDKSMELLITNPDGYLSEIHRILKDADDESESLRKISLYNGRK